MLRNVRRNEGTRKFNRRHFESENDIMYYDGYTDDTVPSVRCDQYNPMIVGEREELYKDIMRSINKKQSSPKYHDDMCVIEGKYVSVESGVEYDYFSTDDFTSVKLVCVLLDNETDAYDNTIETFYKDLVINYYDFMDSYGIESDIEDYIMEELHRYMESILHENDNKHKEENKTTRDLKRSRRYYESLSNSDVERIMDTLREQNTSNKLDSGNFRWSEALNLFQKLLDEEAKGYPYNSDLTVFNKFKKAGYSSARDLISDIAGAVDRRLRELTQVKKDLEELKQIAISFDLKPGHN